MEIFTSLGLNETLFVQMAVFLVVFIILKNVLFEPYFAAFRERKDRTVGQAEAAERYINETRELEVAYSSKAKQINEQFKAIYDRTRTEGAREQDQILQAARAKAKVSVDSSRALIEKEVEGARKTIASDVSSVSQLVTGKLLESGKAASQ